MARAVPTAPAGGGPRGGGRESLGAAFDGAAYAGATAHHRAHDEQTLRGLDLAPGERVLDVGCGVGDLTLALWEAVQPGGTVTGLDVSASVLERAAAAAGDRPGLSWVRAPAQEVDGATEPAGVDAVVSVAALHWVPGGHQHRVLAGIARVLRPGGRLRLDMGGAGQLAEVFAVLDAVSASHGGGSCPLFFPDAATYRALAESAGLVIERCELVAQRRDLGDAGGVGAWLASQVLPAYRPGVAEQVWQDFVAEARERVRATMPDHVAAYVRLRLAAHRPG